ncbi:uncharacterized protein F4822DRAFT_21505 [Hypoxylon trugodes]|uniref:uncharacterized protein n=1 Tax=Hypoxylon trugodes TaxID=326681 RepID=UPI00219B8740|nr:uncharacterized protein F4822DRAFT_21505 [Hypoxylon trugodes]KAI1393705.1 hypothetical protein F4822DRAFT_21505 [Hypoxylon trugodes]
MATPTPPKSMSSRLLTMKFMQRAAVTPSSSPTTPNSDEQPSKRRKVSRVLKHDGRDLIAQIDQTAVRAAIAEEERKRQEALIQHASELGDARWVLDIPNGATGSSRKIQTPLNVVQVGFAQIDSPDPSDATGLDTESTDASHLRTPVVRRYNMDKKQTPKDSDSESDDSNSDSDSDTSSQENGPGRQSFDQKSGSRSDSSRPTVQNKRGAERTKAKQFSEKRRKKDVNLNNNRTPTGGLLSISGGGTPARQPMNFTCHRCGKPGHKIAECKMTPKRTTR